MITSRTYSDHIFFSSSLSPEEQILIRRALINEMATVVIDNLLNSDNNSKTMHFKHLPQFSFFVKKINGICRIVVSRINRTGKKITAIVCVMMLSSYCIQPLGPVNAMPLPIGPSQMTVMQLHEQGMTYQPRCMSELMTGNSRNNFLLKDEYLGLLLHPQFVHLAHFAKQSEIVKRQILSIRGGVNPFLASFILFTLLGFLAIGMTAGFIQPTPFISNGVMPTYFDDRPEPFGPPSILNRLSSDSPRARLDFRPHNPGSLKNMKNSMKITSLKLTDRIQEGNQCSPNKSYIESYWNDDGRVDIEALINEAQRRVNEINPNYIFDQARFKRLAVEREKFGITQKSAREAVSMFQAEALGWAANNTERGDYNGRQGIDFVGQGLGPYENCTHFEITHPMSQRILLAQKQKQTVETQGKKIGLNKVKQSLTWSESTNPRIRQQSNETLPAQPSNVLLIADLFDVGNKNEKVTVQEAITQGLNEGWDTMPSSGPTENHVQFSFLNNKTII